MRCLMTGVMGLIWFLAIAGCASSRQAEAPNVPAPYAASTVSAPEADAECAGSFDLAVEFQGISHLVSARIEHPRDFWVFFPRINRRAGWRLGSSLSVHKPRLYLPRHGVTISGVRAKPSLHCPLGLPECQSVSLAGLDVRVEGAEAPPGEPPLSMNWSEISLSDDQDRSLHRLADFDDLTQRSLEVEQLPPTTPTFAVLQAVPLRDRRLRARFQGTVGHVQTARLWEGAFKLVRGNDGIGPPLPPLARSFELLASGGGCATLRLARLRNSRNVGSIRFEPTDSQVRVIVEHAPKHAAGASSSRPCDHLKSHYLLRDLPRRMRGNRLMTIASASESTSCDANCSPGCSEPKP